MRESINNIFNKAKTHISAIFFICGFLFDLITLNRIDQGLMLIQQALFLALILIFLHIEIKVKLGGKVPATIAKYRVYILHFLFGALLSAFAIFYFLSSSGLNSLLFVLAIIALMFANELPQFQKLNIPFKVALFSVCLISYLSYLTPTILGFLGAGPLMLSGIIFFLLMTLNSVFLQKVTDDNKFINKNFTTPSLITLAVFLGLYFLKVIPPVPLSIKKIGIYRGLEKADGKYILSHKKHPLKFWQSGEKNYRYQEGDKIYCFAGIFSPTNFSDQVKFNWFLETKNGWLLSDEVPIKISGGRDKGFRAYSYKSNIQAGNWRVKVLTKDLREIGRINFTVTNGISDNELQTEIY